MSKVTVSRDPLPWERDERDEPYFPGLTNDSKRPASR